MPDKLRTVFLGTPLFAVPSLEALAHGTDVALVVTQPDRPSGRGRKIELSPVKTRALKLGLEIAQPDIVKGRRFAAAVAERKPDFLVTAAFGRLLGAALLRVPAKACLNVHASLLPRHRGAAPINWAILSGDAVTGVSIMRMDARLDSGPVYLSARTPIEPQETAASLSARLARLGAETLMETIRHFDDLKAEPQDEAEVTWAPMLNKSDGVVDWSKSAVDLHNHVRAMSPWPCSTTLFKGEPLQIHASEVLAALGADNTPGRVLSVGKQGVDVACGEGVLRLLELQAAGRKRLAAAQFLAGTPIEAGAILGG